MKPAERYTTSAAAKLIGLTPARLRQLAGAHQIKAEKVESPVGSYWLIDRAEVLRLKADRAR